MHGKALRPMVALIALALAIPMVNAGAKDSAPYHIGDRVASFTYKSDQGKLVKLSDYKGKVVVLNFFATW